MGKKIYPYLVEAQKMNQYYNYLLESKYKLRFFDNKKDKELLDIFLPNIKNLMFWTVGISSSKKVSKNEFENMPNTLKSAVCTNYLCNIFENNNTTLICFKTGICFAITDDILAVEKAKNNNIKMESINLRSETTYSIQSQTNEAYLYMYILQLYKMIFMNKIQKEMHNPNLFNKTRNSYVKFIEQIYNVRITDNKEAMKLCEKWGKELGLDEYFIKVDNEFDLKYKNNKLNEQIATQRIFTLLFVVAIIIGIINLWGMIS